MVPLATKGSLRLPQVHKHSLLNQVLCSKYRQLLLFKTIIHSNLVLTHKKYRCRQLLGIRFDLCLIINVAAPVYRKQRRVWQQLCRVWQHSAGVRPDLANVAPNTFSIQIVSWPTAPNFTKYQVFRQCSANRNGRIPLEMTNQRSGFVAGFRLASACALLSYVPLKNS